MKKNYILIVFFISINHFVSSQNVLENKYDVKQYILDLQISNASVAISGNVTINANVVATSLDTFVIDLIDTIVANQTYMVVDSVFMNKVLVEFQHYNDLVFVPLAFAVPQNQQFSVQIYYHGKASTSSALWYNGVSVASYLGNTQTYSTGEPFGAKSWFPVKQILTDKADSVIFCITTDSTNKTGSNGLLKSKIILPNGKCKYMWVTHYPIAYYLISFIVGNNYEEKTYYTPLPNQDSVLMQNFLIHDTYYYPIHLIALEKANKLMYLYSEKFGIYPFKNEKYGNCVIGAGWDGMEHQTLCTMGLTLLDTTITSLGNFYCWGNAHEFAHHWFGDYVTCASWNNVWLNEGLGTYVEYIALQNLETQSRANLWMNAYHTYIKSTPSGSVYVPNSELNPNRIFDSRLSYGKGAAVTHMLRYEINNDSIFFAALRNYLNAYAYSTATTDDFKQSVESTTGIDFTDFFNQWIYGAGYPIFNIYWNQNNDTLVLSSDQTTSSPLTTFFKTHFDLQLNYSTGDTSIRLLQGQNHETYKIYFSKNITSINFDPKIWLLQNSLIHTGIVELNNFNLFNIFPNPATAQLTIEIPQLAKENTLAISNINGQELIRQKLVENKTQIDISNMTSGVYFVKLITDKTVEMKKIIKE